VLGGRIFQWILLFQEFDFEFVVNHGRLNAGLDHLSRITNEEEPSNLEENCLDAQLFSVHIADEYFHDIIDFLIQDLDQENLLFRRRNIWWSKLQIIS
jgi:hypothetical protein